MGTAASFIGVTAGLIALAGAVLVYLPSKHEQGIAGLALLMVCVGIILLAMGAVTAGLMQIFFFCPVSVFILYTTMKSFPDPVKIPNRIRLTTIVGIVAISILGILLIRGVYATYNTGLLNLPFQDDTTGELTGIATQLIGDWLYALVLILVLVGIGAITFGIGLNNDGRKPD